MRPQGWVTVLEAAILVGRSKQTIYNWIREHRIPADTTTNVTLVDGRAALEVEASIGDGRFTTRRYPSDD